MKKKFRSTVIGKLRAICSAKAVGMCLDIIDGCMYDLNEGIDIKAEAEYKKGEYHIKITSLEENSKKNRVTFCKKFGKFMASLENRGFELKKLMCKQIYKKKKRST